MLVMNSNNKKNKKFLMIYSKSKMSKKEKKNQKKNKNKNRINN